jgi:uncharacterized membrane protein YphA (DoxX/SURF4 family)
MSSTGLAESPEEPELLVRSLAVLLLRCGLGVNLLNSGLIGYMIMRNGAPGSTTYLVPYVQIFLGIALILGLFTTVAAVGAGLLMIVQPLIQTITMLSGGFPGNPFGRGPAAFQWFAESMTLGNLLVATAVLWLSARARNPWSLDNVIFGQHATRPAVPGRTQRRPDDVADAIPMPGERTASFIATYGESAGPGSTASPQSRGR